MTHPLVKKPYFIDIGERAGSGIPNIFRVWENENRETPVITESYEPERFTLTLKLNFASTNLQPVKSDDKKAAIKSDDKK